MSKTTSKIYNLQDTHWCTALQSILHTSRKDKTIVISTHCWSCVSTSHQSNLCGSDSISSAHVLGYWMFQPYHPQCPCFEGTRVFLFGFSIIAQVSIYTSMHRIACRTSWQTGEGKRWRVTCSAGSRVFFLASRCLKSLLTQLLAHGVKEWHIENPKSSIHYTLFSVWPCRFAIHFLTISSDLVS